MTSLEKSVLVVINPVSGNGSAEKLARVLAAPGPALKSLAEKNGFGEPGSWPMVRTTSDDTWRIEVEAQVRTRGVRTILVLGGDGTLMAVAALLYGLRELDGLALIPVPGGRGNDFTRTLLGYGAPSEEFWDWADARVGRGTPWSSRQLDLASANGRLFLNMASIGYGGRVVENAHERKAIWSKTSLVYQIEGALALGEKGDGRVNVKVDGVSAYMGPFFGAFLGNGKCNGRGLYWTRDARVDDGQLDAIVFPKPGVLDMLRTMSAVKSTAVPPPPLPMRHQMLKGAEIIFHFDRPTALELDGDFIGNAMSHGFTCLPRVLKTWSLSQK